MRHCVYNSISELNKTINVYKHDFVRAYSYNIPTILSIVCFLKNRLQLSSELLVLTLMELNTVFMGIWNS